jgi:hypothetical protein
MRSGGSNRYCGMNSAGRRCLLVLVVASLLVLIVPSAATSAGPPLTVACNGAACSSDWYRGNVTIAFSWDPIGVTSTSGCDTKTVSSDTTGVTFTCTVTYSNSATSSLSATIKRDATTPTVTGASAGRGPDANGWYNHAVGITFNGSDATSGLAGCTSTTYNGPDTAGASFSGTCTDQAGNVSGPASFGPIKYDGTAPSVSASMARGPDSGGWYNHPVGVSVSGSDNLSGVAACNSGTYSGPDVRGGSISGSCTDSAGNSSSRGFPVDYDSTPPSVTGAAAARPPDANGWYSHPVGIAFTGSDATSGVASCTAVTYGGPDNAGAVVNGSCTDQAGNLGGGGTFALKYDSTPPTLANVVVESGDNRAAFSWTASPDTTSIEVTRAPGLSGPDPEVIYKGTSSAFEDLTVRNRVKYEFTITAFDEAGNKATETLTVVPAALLYSPARGALVKAPPLLAWRKMRGASYYNVQVYFGTGGQSVRHVLSVAVAGRKVLSAWPVEARFRMRKQWVFKNKHYKLLRGRYTWYVWPGLGKRSARKYGPLIGKSEFVVSR